MACSTLGPASNFTVFVFGNHTQSNTDSQGRVAVGGNVIYSNYSVGSKLPVSTTRADLIVNGNMNITGGVNFSGNSIISNAANIEKYTMTNNNGVGNQPLIESYIDFEATQKYLRCLSQRLSEQPSTGDVQPQSWGGLYLIGNDPNLNIFTFDGTNIEGSGLTLGSINTLNIIAPEGSTILINALGENISFQNYGMFFNGSTISESQNKLIFWNLPNAINLFSSGISIKGTLLAPYATANMNNGNIDGSLIVQNLSGNIEEHYMLFQGCLPEVDCPIVTSIVGDFVWNDINRNGIIDPGETGISGVTATLYNCNGTSTGLSAITDSNGFYYITGVNPGRYYVQFSNLPNNYVFVTAGGFVDINGKTACFDVGVTEFISNIDAPAAFSSTPTASIGDYVWLDKNRNGIIDTGATGIPNVTVTLYKSDGSSTGLSTMTDQDGYYKINGIPPGSYYVVFSGVPTGYEFIAANGLVDSSGKSPEFTLTGGQINNTIDAPVAPIRGSIGDLVWNDVNGNGQLDDGEVGVPGVTVTLYNCYDDGTLVLPNPSYTTITDSNGKYTIDNIEPGEYYVIFTTLPPDYNFITAGDYVDKNGKSNCFTINPESNLTNIDAPIAQNPTPASITGLVWNDINRDNIVDSGENGVPGVTVTLYNCDGNPTGLSTTTNTDGTYTIANIQPGSYYVVFRNLPDDYEFVSGIYVNSQGRNPSNSSECIILGDGEIKTDVNAPIAEALTPLASIGDLVWYDLNRDGEYNPGETGVPGVIVTLFYSNGNPTGLSAVTNAAGIYAINNIQPGEYYVIFSNIPNKYDFVVTENSFIDSTGRSDNFTLISNEVNNTIDAPIAPQYATIGDKVIYDTNRNGARDPGELGVPNVLVTLYDCTDVDAENPLATAITNSNGIYSIDNIEPGEYYVIFSEIPTDYVFITTNNYTNEKGISSCFDLQPGEINNRIDAFIAIDTPRSAQVGDFVWYDKNRNGIIDANERGVSGVTARLYKADTDELIDITSTNISGIYGITGIPAGQYYVKFSDIPPGYRFFYESGLVDETGRSNVFTLKDSDIIDYVDAPIVEQEGSVSGFAWNDVNNDGVKQSNENNVEGMVVTLYTCTGEKTNYSAITDSNGNYFISNVVPGQYRAVFSNIPSNYKFVTAGDYVTSTGVTPTCFTVSPNETTTNINSPISLSYTPVVIPYTRYNAQFLTTCSRVICSNSSIIFDCIDISLNNPYIISEQSLNIFRLLPGIYLINYSASVKSNSIYGIDNIKLGICVDGNIIMGSESHTTIGQAGTGNLFGTIIINLNSASLIGLYNLSTHPINVLQSTMTVVKIS